MLRGPTCTSTLKLWEIFRGKGSKSRERESAMSESIRIVNISNADLMLLILKNDCRRWDFRWLKGHDLKSIIEKVEEPHHMFWLLSLITDQAEVLTRKDLIQIACECAEIVYRFSNPEQARYHPHLMVDMVRRYIKGDPLLSLTDLQCVAESSNSTEQVAACLVQAVHSEAIFHFAVYLSNAIVAVANAFGNLFFADTEAQELAKKASYIWMSNTIRRHIQIVGAQSEFA